ncbi:MAG: hypothetical protein AB7I27_04540 [Bacteriovoracaceae bacterium]
MQLMLMRMFAYFTVFVYLMVGIVAVRIFSPSLSEITFDTNYFSILAPFNVADVNYVENEKVELSFAEINFPKNVQKELVKVVEKKKTPIIREIKKSFELPFNEPVVLTKIEFNAKLLENLISFYQSAPIDQKILLAQAEVTEQIKDEVSTKQANDLPSEENAEPEFFDYPEKKDEAKQEAEPTVETVNTKSPKNSIEEEVAVSDLVAYEYGSPAKQIANSAEKPAEKIVKTPAMTVVNNTNQPATFDYSAATKAVKNQKIPTVSKVNTHPQVAKIKETENKQKEENAFMAPETKGHLSQVTIQIVGSDLRKTSNLKDFEVRFQDDQSQQREDYATGQITLNEELSSSKMNRAVTILKRGFTPTNVDLILEEGASVASVPLIEENKFDELMSKHPSKFLTGAVLIEMDDETEVADLDVPYAVSLNLDGNMNETNSDDYRYKLFVGVKAGNALLSYKDSASRSVNKIIHIHENELTYESNFYEPISNESVALFEEDLLSKEKAPLILASEQVKQFASDKYSKKLNSHTYKMDFERALLGSRRYLELNHQQEPVFVGIRENMEVKVPSENLMRYMLSRFENSKLGNRCLVQVNLSKKASSFEIGAESSGQSLRTYTQVLDSDGKFYDSMSDKTEKLIIVGEHEGSEELSQDGKINILIQYQDNTTEYLSSYCSPNTYLVEQL